MTKVITIRSCYILIAIWILSSILPLLPLYHYQTILNSIDENGCRISQQDKNEIVCPDKPIRKDDAGNLICSMETCKPSGTMASTEEIENSRTAMIIIEILIQFIAFLCWNMHFKWFTIKLKSCWVDN